jgi:prevent-host-death family protein
MNLTRDIQPLTDFKRDTGRFMRQLKETGDPVILTVNGKAELVVQDAESYQRLLEMRDHLEAILDIRESEAAFERGEGVPVGEVFDSLFRKFNLEGGK